LYVYLKDDSKTLLSPIPLLYAVDSGYDVKKMMPSEAVEFVNGVKRKSSILSEKKIMFLKILEKEHKKVESNVFNLEKDLLECSKVEDLQFKAELIMGNIYKLNPKKNYEIIDVTDWNTGREKRIELNKKYNLSSNAQRMFKKSSKLKRRKDIVERRISKLSKKLFYIEEIIHSIDLIETEDDLKEIKQEMMESGFIKEKVLKKKGKTPKKITGIPRKFNYMEFEIFVGKNNRQNDRICHTFSREEYWFHAQKIPGSHVVINSAGREIPEDVLNMAARLAAYFSKGKNGTKIPVDYTKLKYVKKPKGAAPGFVIYDNFKTFIVDPMKVLEDIKE
jgi:predicted ribosome quality control (RQC) complex YloA/Tae2 family protein